MNWSVELAAEPWQRALAAAAALVCGWHLWQGRRAQGLGRRAGAAILVLRGAAAGVLLLAALLPCVSVSEPALVKPRLLVLVDAGYSMQSASGGGTRMQTALKWLGRNRKAVEERCEPEVFAVSDRARPVAGLGGLDRVEPSDAGFQAVDAILDVAQASGRKADRAWLLSDGNAVHADGVERALSRLGVPVDVIGVGPGRRGKGMSFSAIKTPDFVFLHGRFPVELSVEATGLAGERLRLALLKEEPSGPGSGPPGPGSGPPGRGSWKTLDSRTFTAGSDYEILQASFSAVAESLGRERYRLEAGILSKASPLASRDLGVEVIRQKYRIMYLSGRPSYGYSALREFMKSDPNHELVSFVILRNPESALLVPDHELSLIPFPAEEIFARSLSQFDLFILENFSYRRFNLPVAYLNGLKGFVASGGALLVIGGEQAFGLGGYRATPLEDILPVTLSASAEDFVLARFSPKPSSLSHPLLGIYETQPVSQAAWDGLPPLFGYAKFGSVREGTSVLLVHPKEKTESGQALPVMALRNYGRGKVLLVSTDSTWRWKLGASRDWKLAGFYGRFWTRAVQYLTGSLDLSKVKFAPVPDKIAPREPAVFILRVFDENFRPAQAGVEPTVLWTQPDGKVTSVWAREGEPGAFRVELTGLKEGGHSLKASVKLAGKPWGEDSARFSWHAAGSEAPMDRQFLERVASAGGGRFTPLAAARAGELLDALPAVREESRLTRRHYPWTQRSWLLLACLLFLAEWALRRSRGYD
ncbi:MAG: hypothetical protein HY927_04350 [Elusimicrobia bacterium]|nr:hypothetical protein [Elusimicrobiota bacterium]